MEKIERTYCKYGDCSLEKLESELYLLEKIWLSLKDNWSSLLDYEDLYRIYPLLDTTAALARKKVINCQKKDKNYKCEIRRPSSKKEIEKSNYKLEKFLNSTKEEILLADIVSVFLHSSDYEYIDNGREKLKDNYEIHLHVKTDKLCENCIKENKNVIRKIYKKEGCFTTYIDCTCGIYVDIGSYIKSMKELLNNKKPHKKTIPNKFP
jgi:hypothetical protein